MAGRRLHHRPLKQHRSGETLDRILSATTDLLREASFDEISVQRIVERARTSKGAFYFRFANKAHVLRTLGERSVSAELEDWTEFFGRSEWRQAAVADFIAAFVDRLASVYADRRNLLRALMQELETTDDAIFRSRMLDLSRQILTKYASVITEKVAEVRHPRPELAIPFSGMLIAGVLHRSVLEAPRTLWGQTDLTLVKAEVSRAATLYLVSPL